MGALVSRKQLLSFFIQASHLLKRFYSIKESLDFNELTDEELEQRIAIERSHQDFERLVSFLILSEQYFIKKKEYNMATIYLIECQSLLEEIDSNNILKIYIYLELGYIYELNKCYKEADHHYTKALEHSFEKKNSFLISYSFEKLSQIILESCDRKGVVKFNTLIESLGEEYVSLTNRVIFELIGLYMKKDYDKVLECLSSYQNHKKLNQNQEFFMITHIIKTQTYYQLNRIQDIRWIDFRESSCRLNHRAFTMLYELFYRLVHNQDEIMDYIEKISTQLNETRDYYILKAIYSSLLTDKNIINNKESYSKVYELLSQNRQRLNYEEDILKTRVQNAYRSYREYYHNLEPVKFEKKYRVLPWQQMSAHYQREYNAQTLLGFFMIEDCFCGEFTQELKQHVVAKINELIQEDVTFSFHDHGVWFYFNACTVGMKLKQKLNALLKPLYEELKLKYTITFCLPLCASRDFYKTARSVYASFYSMVVNTKLDQDYSVSFGRESSSDLYITEQIPHIFLKAYKEKKFSIEKKYFYNKGGKELFGVEFKGVLSEVNLILDMFEDNKEIVRESLVMELEMSTLDEGCRLIKEQYQNIHPMPYLFIKFSRETLMNKLIVGRILNCLKRYNINYNQVIISINEDVLFENNEFLQKLINRLHELGIGVALDDYGTGSLTGSIRNLNINYLKISPSLIQYLNSSYQHSGMMKSLISICSNYDVKICCSDIESKSSHDLISHFGIDVVSGSYYQRKLVV